MPEEWRTQQRARADAHLAAFLAANPGYSLDGGRLDWLLGTHYVTFGSGRGGPVVFKYYDGDPRKEHEGRALKLFAPTGLVPEVLSETDVMLVMERLPGLPMNETERRLTQPELDALYLSLGEAVARVVEVAPGGGVTAGPAARFRAADEGDFYNTPYDALHVLYRQADAATFFDTTLARAARVLRDRHVAHQDVLARSLAALQQNRDAILSHREFVHMDDFHTNNIMADGTRVTGFIDLEMTRCGNEVLLLGAVLCSMCGRPELWGPFRQGYEHARGKRLDDATLALVQSAAPFSQWIRFTWYCSTDDTPHWAVGMNLGQGTVESIAETVEGVGRMAL